MPNNRTDIYKQLMQRVGKVRVYDAMFEVLEAAHCLHLESPVCQDILGVLHSAVVQQQRGDFMDIAEDVDVDGQPPYYIAAEWHNYFRKCGCELPVNEVLAAAYSAGCKVMEGVRDCAD